MVSFPLEDVNIDEDGRLTRYSLKVFIKKGRRIESSTRTKISHSNVT